VVGRSTEWTIKRYLKCIGTCLAAGIPLEWHSISEEDNMGEQDTRAPLTIKPANKLHNTSSVIDFVIHPDLKQCYLEPATPMMQAVRLCLPAQAIAANRQCPRVRGRLGHLRQRNEKSQALVLDRAARAVQITVVPTPEAAAKSKRRPSFVEPRSSSLRLERLLARSCGLCNSHLGVLRPARLRPAPVCAEAHTAAPSQLCYLPPSARWALGGQGTSP
jgi:hypothetical protein